MEDSNNNSYDFIDIEEHEEHEESRGHVNAVNDHNDSAPLINQSVSTAAQSAATSMAVSSSLPNTAAASSVTANTSAPINPQEIRRAASMKKASSCSGRHSSSRKSKSSNSQALLRAKASLTCPVSFVRRSSSDSSSVRFSPQRNSQRFAPSVASLASNSNSNNDVNRSAAAVHNSHQSQQQSSTRSLPENIAPPRRQFGLQHSNISSVGNTSTHSLASVTSQNENPQKLTSGEWKDVEIITNTSTASANHSLSSSTPSARSLHAAAIWNDQLLLFGGYDGTSRRNDFFSFHFKQKTWTRIDERSQTQSINLNVQIGNVIHGNPPSPRDRHTAVVYNDCFWVFGGFDGHARINDLHRYDLVRGEWSTIIPSIESTVPSPRHSHNAVVHKNSMYVWGGYAGSYSCDLYEYNFDENIWRIVHTLGRIPRARYRATCVIYKDTMIVHSGHDGTRHLSDTHALDMNTMTWTSLSNVGGISPIPRDSQVGFVYENSLFIMGGSAGGTAMNDMYELVLEGSEAETPTWRKVICNGTISPRFCHVGAFNEEESIFYVHGGYTGDSRLGDFMKFEFNVDDLSYDIPPSTLTSDMQSLVNNELLSDVTFVVSGQTIYAHKMMLIRSPYFRAMFTGSMMESNQSEIHIEEVRILMLYFYQIYLL